MEHGSKTRLLSAVVIAAVFGSGVLIGLAADSSLGAAAATVAERVDPAETEGEKPDRPRTPIWPQVGPTPAQEAAIDSIVDVYRARRKAFDEQRREEYERLVREIVLETREVIKGVFTPDQAAEYERLLDEWDAYREEERRKEAEAARGDGDAS